MYSQFIGTIEVFTAIFMKDLPTVGVGKWKTGPQLWSYEGMISSRLLLFIVIHYYKVYYYEIHHNEVQFQ